MKKYLKHLGEIIVGSILIFLFTCVDLNDYPVIRSLDYVFWPMSFLFLTISLFYCWRHRSCFLLGVFLISSPVIAGTYTTEICSYYNSYKQRIEKYKENYFVQDEPCDEDIREKAKVESEEYKISLLDTVTGNAANKKIGEWMSGSCANDLMNMCSAYEKRHPETVTKTVPVLLNEAVGKKTAGGKATSCWPCDMAYVVFTVIQALSNNLAEMMSSVAFKILIFGTLFWLLFKAAGMVLTSKGGTYFKQIAGGLLAVMIAAWLLRNNGQNLSHLYSSFLSPVIQMGLTVSDKIQSTVGMGSPTFSAMTGSTGEPFYKQLENRSAARLTSRTDFTDYCGYDASSASGSGSSLVDILSSWYITISGQAFPTLSTNFSALTSEANSNKTLLTDDLKTQFLCLTQKFYNQSRPFIATGQSLISFASHDTKGFLHFVTRFPANMKMWVMGALLVCVFTYFSFLVAFRIMDIFLRLGFILVLMPLFVVTTVFPITREYTQKAWTFLFQVIVEFIGLAISVSFVMIMLEGVVMPESNELLDAMTAEYSEDYGENLFKAVTKDMTLAFPLLLFCVVLLGQKLMKSFPIIIATLFDVPDSSHKGDAGTMMSGAIGGLAVKAYGTYKSAKGAAQTAAKNPYKTKETKAKEAEKDLRDKQKKLAEEKKKPNNKANIDKAQKDVDAAQKKATALRADADQEKQKTDPSRSGYAARRFGYNAGNAVRKGAGNVAEAVEKFGSKVGGTLTKTGIGAVVGIPLTLGAKVTSAGIRAGAKITEVGLKATGRAGATVQKIGNKLTGRPPPPPRP